MPTVAYPEADAARLRTSVRERAFFEKLSRDWNLVPKTAGERAQLLEIADHLRTAKAQEAEKTAGAGNPFLASALDGLRTALRLEGVDASAGDAARIKQAAFNLTHDPEIAYAALGLAEYLAAAEAGQA